MLIFDRTVPTDDETSLRVEAAFLLQTEDGASQPSIVPCGTSHLVVFLPTEKETHLNFLIQGPYRTTPARDNIPESDPLNQRLVAQTASLVADSLETIRDMALLTVGCLRALPLSSLDFPFGSMFRPIYDSVRNALLTRPLLPTDHGQFVSANSAALGRGVPIRRLLNGRQLQVLLKSHVSVEWLHADITQDRSPELRGYLIREFGIREVSPEWFAQQVDGSFFETQSDEWMISCYRFLGGQEALWRGSLMPYGSSMRGILLDKPFIRLENGRHVAPFSRDGQPNAFVANALDGELPIVGLAINGDDDARAFLIKLGLTEPDVVVEVMARILPLYRRSGGFDVGYDEHRAHLNAISRALGTASGKRRTDLITAISRTPFLRGQNVDKSLAEMKRPGDLYFRSPHLELYFANNSLIRFVGDQYDPFRRELEDIGVAKTVRVTARQADSSGYVTITSDRGDHERGINSFDPDCDIDGLQTAVSHPEAQRSAYIWNQLLRLNVRRVFGVVERSTIRTYGDPTREERWSRMGSQVREYAWVPTSDGSLKRPQDMTLAELPEDFERDELLAEKLGMRSRAVVALAKEAGVDASVLEFVLHNSDKIRELMRTQVQASLVPPDDDEDTESYFNYQDELVKAFSRPGETHIVDEDAWIAAGPIRNPDGRRAVISEQFEDSIANATLPSRMFQVVPTKKWQAKNNAARGFLMEQYHGKCQICASTFPRRDGRPYFEGLYLVSRVKAEWIDHSGNILCLCPKCCAMFKHGSVEAASIAEQIAQQRVLNAGGADDLKLEVTLCGETTYISFTDRHMINLQEIVKATQEH